MPLDAILGRGAFDLDRIAEAGARLPQPAHGEAGHVHDEDCDHDHDHDHEHHDHGHDDGHPGRLADLDKPIDGQDHPLAERGLRQEQGPDILRAKGIIDVAGEDRAAWSSRPCT